MRAIEEVTRYDAAMRQNRNKQTRQFGRSLSSLISELQQSGSADPALDPALTTAILGSITLRFPEMWLIDRVVNGEFDAVVEQVASVFVKVLGLSRDASSQGSRRQA
jgi:hypothetical protein